MRKSGNRGLSRYLLVWSVVSVLAVGGSMATTQSNHASKTKEGKVNLAPKTKIESPGIPAIDAAAPSIIETATFGLG